MATTPPQSSIYSPFLYEGQIFQKMNGGRMQKTRRRQETKLLRETSFHVKDDHDRVQLVVPFPGIKGKDLSVDLNGSLLTISGTRQIEQGHSRKRFKFSKGFSLDPCLDSSQMTAQWSDGVLIVSAPRRKSSPLLSSAASRRQRLNTEYSIPAREVECRDDRLGCCSATLGNSVVRDDKENHRDDVNHY